jgi:HlyD family secretion protein
MKKLLAAIFLPLIVSCTTPPTVKTARVSRQTVEATVTSVTSGTVRAEKIAELAFGAVGRVKNLNVSVGDLVKQGQVLAELENTDLIAVRDTANRELSRRQRLRDSNAIPQSDVEQMRRDLEMATVAYDKSRIVAPYDGLIAELNLEVGQLSQITAVLPKPLMTIVDLAPRYVRAEIDEVDLGRVKSEQSARVKILALRKEPFPAQVRKVVPFISTLREQDRTAEIELSVDSQGNLLPAGASADIEIIVDTHADVLSAPTRAVLGRGKNRHVFVVSGNRLEKRGVEVGLFNYDYTEIVSGLDGSEVIAFPSDGVELSDNLKVSVSP